MKCFKSIKKLIPTTTVEVFKKKLFAIRRSLGRILLVCVINDKHAIPSHIFQLLFRNSKCIVCQPINEEFIN